MSLACLTPLRISDRPRIDGILHQRAAMLSSYSFVSHYIWKNIFRFYWGIIDNHLCLFAQHDHYIYMPIPPLPCNDSVNDAIAKASIEDALHKHLSLSIIPTDCTGPGEKEFRIEAKLISIQNIEESQVDNFLSQGYKVMPSEEEYVYLREDIVNLRGNRYKSKRAMCNYFIKHYDYSYEPFEPRFIDACYQLHERWKRLKKNKSDSDFFHSLLDDSSSAHKVAMKHHKSLGLKGRMVLVNRQPEGYVFGFGRGETFYILMEVANPEIRGLAQFIFREFCREISDYQYINVLGDSGLENLRKVKVSYRPFKIIPSYTAYLF